MLNSQFIVNRLTAAEAYRLISGIQTLPNVGYNGTLCWIWSKGQFEGGYGSIRWRGESVYTHRLAYAWLVGPIPEHPINGQVPELDHLCRNRLCCNPLHLELVSRRDNVLRGEGLAAQNFRKTHCKNGHELTPLNTYYQPSKPTYRECRTCRRESSLRRYHKRKDSLLTPPSPP